MIKHYVKIEFSGYSPERFLNMCKHKGFPIWDLVCKENTLECYIFAKDFKKIKSMVKKTNLKLRIIEKHGVNFIIFHYRKRKLFYFGLIIGVLIIFYATGRIWNIDIQGNQSITDDLLYEYLDEKDVFLGMKKRNVDCENICKMLRRDFSEIIWVSTSLEGTRMMIDIRENTDTLYKSEESTVYRDIISNIDGVVTSIITRKGVPLIKEGDEIRQGDMLVSGKIEILNDAGEVIREQFVYADADIYVKHKISYKDSCNNTHEIKHYGMSKKKIVSLQLFSYKVDVGFHSKDNLHEIRTYQKQIFPFLILTIKTSQEYELEQLEYETEEQEMILKSSYENFLNELRSNNIEVLSEDVDYINGHNEMLYIGNIEVIQQVVDLY